MCGSSLYESSDSFIYPKLLTEVHNKTLIEYAIDCFKKIKEDYKIIFVAPKDKVKELDLKAIIDLISEKKGELVEVSGYPKGALCTVLAALDSIDDDDEIVISSADHYIQDDIEKLLAKFRSKDANAGVVTFNSVHPKWSYVKKDENNFVIEASEKKVISRDALIGLTYFKKAIEFIESAKQAIRKGSSHESSFYTSSCLNEMSLLGKKIIAVQSESKVYHNFYDNHAIKSFEKEVGINSDIRTKTKEYIDRFNAKDIDVIQLFDEEARLLDPQNKIYGKNNIYEFISNLFENIESLKFEEKRILTEESTSVIEFHLIIDGKKFVGTDIIQWNDGRIISLDAYLYEVNVK